MEGYKASEIGTDEIYMIQGSDSYSQLASTPSLEQFEVMDTEGAPEFIVDQGLYYPAATNYYPYYFTGYESTGEWDDRHGFLGLDSNLHYAGLQTESLPYVYYTPSYGYAQSPYNPYNPYIPGAVIGADGSFIGMQQYYTGSTYPQPASPAYYPLLVHPMMENNGHETHLLNAGVSYANGSDVPGNLQSTSGGSLKAPQRLSMGDGDKTLSQSHSSNNRSETSKTIVANNKEPATQMSIASASVPRAASSQSGQDINYSGSVQGSYQLAFGQGPSLHSPAKVSLPANASTDFGTNTRGISMVDWFRPRLHYGGVSNNGNMDPDFLSEQNRGPRTNRSRGQWIPSTSVELHATNVGSSANGKIIVCADQYNKENFPVDYVDGKFFVIKSYSEDDVHKSIKYNVWSSTPNGNKRLGAAYEDAQRIAAGNSRGCPVFLFFSVNASGQFCGVAEMIGPVDFNKDMNFWQQDKWSGSFPVKWHIIKDVPNANFRHIILENNENKPVTNSRDTQEIKYRQGLEMLSIFKNHTLKTSILDDFMYYEERQRIMQEEKARFHGKSYNNSFYIPAIVHLEKRSSIAKQSCIDEAVKMPKHQNSLGRKMISTIDQSPLSSEVGNTKHNSLEEKKGVTSTLKIESMSIEPKHAENHPASAAVRGATTELADNLPVGSKSFPNSSNTKVGSTKHKSVELNNSVTESSKIDFLPIDLKAETKPAAASMTATTDTDVFTVGSMPVKVNGFSEASSGILKVGSIPIVPRVVLDKANRVVLDKATLVVLDKANRVVLDKPNAGTSSTGGI